MKRTLLLMLALLVIGSAIPAYALASPTNIAVSNIGVNSATITWEPGDSETTFNVAYRKAATDEWITAGTVNATTYTFNELEAGTEYEARVQSVAGDATSDWSTISFVTDFCGPEDMGVIVCNLNDSYGDGWNGASLQVVNSAGTVVSTLTIQGGNSNTDTLMLCPGTYTLMWVKGNYDSECSFTISDLNGEVLFQHNSGSSPAAGEMGTIAVSHIANPRPVNFTVSNLTANSATLSWTPGGNESEWNVAFKRRADEQWTTHRVTATLIDLDELEAGTEYEARVQAVYTDGESAWNETLFRTLYCNPEEQASLPYELTDSYGDGWNGACITVLNSDSVVVATLTVDPGNSSQSGTLELCYGYTYTFVWVKGSYDGECSFTITDHEGETIYSGGAPASGEFATYTLERITCPKPVNVSADQVNYFNATVTWTPGNEDQDIWEVAYGTSGNFDNLAVMTVNITPAVELTQLQDGETYHVYVRANCGDGDYSKWSDEITFTTPEVYPRPDSLRIDSITPYSATFTWAKAPESESTTLRYRKMVGFADDFESGSLDRWTLVDADGDSINWEIRNLADETDNFGYPYCFDDYCVTSASYINNVGVLVPDNWLITPKVTLGGTLSFYTRALDPSYTNDYLELYVSTSGTNPEDFVPLSNGVICPQPETLTLHTYDLSAYSGEGYIAFRHYNSEDEYQIILDNVAVSSPVGNEWIVVENATSPCHLTGLEPEANYEVQLCANYSSGSSRWTESQIFSTLSLNIPPTNLNDDKVTGTTATVSWEGYQESYNVRYRKSESGYTCTFQDNNEINLWTSLNNDSNENTWFAATAEYDSNGNPYFFDKIGFASITEENTDHWLVSPLVSLDGMLSFYARGFDTENPAETFSVLVAPTLDEPTIEDFTIELIHDTVAAAVLTEYTVDVSSFGQQFCYVAIRHTGGTANSGLCVDNFSVGYQPAGEWVSVNNVTSPYTITRLSPETKYDFEVQGNLADGATTDWSYTETFITDPSTVIPGDVNGDGLVNVADVNILISIVLGIDTLDDYPNADLNGDGTGGIADLNLLINIVLENQ